jgi:hypothetical protein
MLPSRQTQSMWKESTFFPTRKRVQWIAHQNEPRAGKSRTNLSTKQGTTAFQLSVDVPGGEEQRKFRRTVYTHDDWRKHRSQDRFVYYLAAFFKSGVYKNLGREVGFVTLVAIFVCVYNVRGSGKFKENYAAPTMCTLNKQSNGSHV